MKKRLTLLLLVLLLLLPAGCKAAGRRRQSSEPLAQDSAVPERYEAQDSAVPERYEAHYPERYEAHYFDVFDTEISLVGYAGSQEEFDSYSRIVYDEMRRLHQLFDIYNDYEGISNLKTVNDNAGLRPVRVEPDILELLELSKQAYADTGGAVNVAMGSVLRIWHEYRTAGVALPATRELRAASLHTDIDDVVIDRQNATVFLADSGLSLDVGAVAKGYAAQKAIDKAVEAGLTSGILNAGGNICVVGSPGDGRENWSVGIQAPQLTEADVQEIIDTVYLSGPAAVVTSGDYQRFYTVDDVAYHHIIDPQTLFPARNAKAVTVIHPDSATADVLSTAVFILPYEQGLALVQRMGAEALWLWEDGTETATDGYRALAKSGRAG